MTVRLGKLWRQSMTLIMEVLYVFTDSEGVQVSPDDCNTVAVLEGDVLDALNSKFPRCLRFVWDISRPAWKEVNKITAGLVKDNARLRIVQSAASSSGNRSITAVEFEAYKSEQEDVRLQDRLLKLQSYKTPAEIGRQIQEVVTEGGQRNKFAFNKILAALDQSLLEKLLEDKEAVFA
jgi:hypothetical protein